MTSDAVQQSRLEGPGAHRVPVPFSPEFVAGPQWFGPAGGAALAESASGVSGAEPLTEVDRLPVVPLTARDAAESAMRIVTQIDSAMAGLEAMRTGLLGGIARIAIDDALAEHLDPGIGLRDVAAELALLERKHDRTVESELTEAMRRSEEWPTTVAAWGAGRIHRGHVAVLVEVGGVLQEPAARAAFEALLLPVAETVNPSRLRAVARRELERFLSEPFAVRHERARKGRGVFLRDVDDGMSLLQALVPSVLGHGIFDRLTQMAKAGAPLIEAGDGGTDARTFDQLRADAFSDLMLTGEPTATAIEGIRAEVGILIPAPVITHTSDTVANGTDGDATGATVARLTNGAPVDPESARILAELASSWRRLFTDPCTGHVTAVDTYVPSVRLKQLLRARDQRCRWPGCSARAVRCDLDHTVPWVEGGKTEVGNLAHLCRRHHTLKGAKLSHARRWKVRQVSPGVLEFVTPMGEIYIDEPPPTGPVFREREPAGVWGGPSIGDGQGDLPF